MSISCVQDVITGSDTHVTSMTTTALGSGLTQGNLVVATVKAGGNNITFTAPDSSWLSAVYTAGNGTNTKSLQIFYMVIDATHAGETSWTWNQSFAASFVITIAEYNATGGWPSSPFDVSGISNPSTSTTTINSGTTVTTAQTQELWIALLTYSGNTQSPAYSNLTSGWTERGQWIESAGTAYVMHADSFASTTAAAACSFTVNPAANNAGLIATFIDNATVTDTYTFTDTLTITDDSTDTQIGLETDVLTSNDVSINVPANLGQDTLTFSETTLIMGVFNSSDTLTSVETYQDILLYAIIEALALNDVSINVPANLGQDTLTFSETTLVIGIVDVPDALASIEVYQDTLSYTIIEALALNDVSINVPTGLETDILLALESDAYGLQERENESQLLSDVSLCLLTFLAPFESITGTEKEAYSLTLIPVETLLESDLLQATFTQFWSDAQTLVEAYVTAIIALENETLTFTETKIISLFLGIVEASAVSDGATITGIQQEGDSLNSLEETLSGEGYQPVDQLLAIELGVIIEAITSIDALSLQDITKNTGIFAEQEILGLTEQLSFVFVLTLFENLQANDTSYLWLDTKEVESLTLLEQVTFMGVILDNEGFILFEQNTFEIAGMVSDALSETEVVQSIITMFASEILAENEVIQTLVRFVPVDILLANELLFKAIQFFIIEQETLQDVTIAITQVLVSDLASSTEQTEWMLTVFAQDRLTSVDLSSITNIETYVYTFIDQVVILEQSTFTLFVFWQTQTLPSDDFYFTTQATSQDILAVQEAFFNIITLAIVESENVLDVSITEITRVISEISIIQEITQNSIAFSSPDDLLIEEAFFASQLFSFFDTETMVEVVLTIGVLQGKDTLTSQNTINLLTMLFEVNSFTVSDILNVSFFAQNIAIALIPQENSAFTLQAYPIELLATQDTLLATLFNQILESSLLSFTSLTVLLQENESGVLVSGENFVNTFTIAKEDNITFYDIFSNTTQATTSDSETLLEQFVITYTVIEVTVGTLAEKLQTIVELSILELIDVTELFSYLHYLTYILPPDTLGIIDEITYSVSSFLALQGVVLSGYAQGIVVSGNALGNVLTGYTQGEIV